MRVSIDTCLIFYGNAVKFHCKIEPEGVEIDEYTQLAVFRTLQELMINVVKHAEATRAQASIKFHHNKLTVRVRDNGKGIDPEKLSRDGIGLASIRSKVDLLSGTVDIQSAPGKGTAIKVVLPYIPAKTN